MNQRTYFIMSCGLVCGLLAGAGGSCHRADTWEGRGDNSSAPAVREEVAGREVAEGASLSGFKAVCNDTDFKQGISYGGIWDDDNPFAFALRNKYRDPGTGEWATHVFEYSASFELRGADPQKTNVFFIHGVASNGDRVIEKWKAGGGLVGGGSQSSPPLMMRKEIYRGSTLGEIRLLGADPEGRFLLLLHGSNPLLLSRMELCAGYPVTTVLNAIDEPSLEDATGYFVAQHETEGRVWVFSGPELRTILYDFQNDGQFDSWVTVDEDGWLAIGYDGPVWTNDFINLSWWD